MNQQGSDLVKLTGMWMKQTKADEAYWSGSLGGARVLLFANHNRTSENQPSHLLFVGRNESRDGGGERQADSAPARREQPNRSSAPRGQSSSTEQFRIEPGETKTPNSTCRFDRTRS